MIDLTSLWGGSNYTLTTNLMHLLLLYTAQPDMICNPSPIILGGCSLWLICALFSLWGWVFFFCLHFFRDFFRLLSNCICVHWSCWEVCYYILILLFILLLLLLVGVGGVTTYYYGQSFVSFLLYICLYCKIVYDNNRMCQKGCAIVGMICSWISWR